MAFTRGVVGGVACTLSAAYLTALAHQRNREAQAQSLRASSLTIQSLLDPIPEPLPPTRSEVAAAERAHTVEVAKDRWNHEVENAVRWVQHTDWTEVRENAETTLGNLWTKTFGVTVQESEEAAEQKVGDLASAAKASAVRTGSDVASATKSAWERAKDKTQRAESEAEDKARQAEARAAEAARDTKEQAGWKAQEAQGVASSLFDKAKAAVGMAEAKMEEKLGVDPLPTLSPVQKALQQRYERTGARDKRTVAQVLSERYIPLDQRDNTTLRGV